MELYTSAKLLYVVILLPSSMPCRALHQEWESLFDIFPWESHGNWSVHGIIWEWELVGIKKDLC